MSNAGREMVERLAIEIYQCFLKIIPPETEPLLAEYSAKAMTVAAIDRALIEGVPEGLSPEAILLGLLNNLRRDEYVPEVSKTIH